MLGPLTCMPTNKFAVLLTVTLFVPSVLAVSVSGPVTADGTCAIGLITSVPGPDFTNPTLPMIGVLNVVLFEVDCTHTYRSVLPEVIPELTFCEVKEIFWLAFEM